MVIKHLAISYLITCAVVLSAQNPYIHHYTTLNGLPSNTVYQIFQDSQKFVWLTTDAGVVKFDGSSFKNFRKRDGLNSNDVIRIREDSFGRIWFSNINGSLNYFYNDSIYNQRNAPFLKHLVSGDFFIDFFEDTDGTLYFYNRHSEVYSLDISNTVTKYNVGNLEQDSPFNSKYCLYMYIHYVQKTITDDFLFWTSCGIFKLIDLNGPKHEIGSFVGVLGVFPIKNNIAYVNTTNCGLLKYTGTDKSESIFIPCASNKIRTVLEDTDGYLWIAAFDEGVFCLKNNKVIRHFDIKDSQGIIQDHEKNIWVSSMTDGIYIINHEILTQKHYESTFFKDQNIIKMSTSISKSGLWAINGKILYYLTNYRIYQKKIETRDRSFNFIQELDTNTIIIGEKGYKNYIYNIPNTHNSNKLISIRLKSTYPYCIKNTDQNNDNFLTHDQSYVGLSKTESPSKSIKRTYINERINNAFYNTNNEVIINATKNYVLNGQKKELYTKLTRFNGSIIKDHLIIEKNSELFNIDGDSIYLLFQDKFYNLTKVSTIFINPLIKHIIYYKSNLFFSTSRDIFRCNNIQNIAFHKKIEVQPFNITFNEIKDMICFHDSLFIASNEGLTIIPFTSIFNNISPSPIPYIKSISVNDNNRTELNQTINLVGKNRINLSFGSINFYSKSILYAYELVNVNAVDIVDNWTLGLGSGADVSFQNLPKGNYIFKLRMRKSNSDWSTPLELKININPTFWERPIVWYALFVIIVFLTTIVVIQIKNLKIKKVERAHKIIVLEQKTLQAMMNPHFIFNSLGSIQNYLIQHNLEKGIEYLTQFSRLIRLNLYALKLNMTIIDDEIDRIHKYLLLEQMRFDNKFDILMNIDDNLINDNIAIPSMIIQPFVENSIWHGIAGLKIQCYIKLEFTIENDSILKVIVEDNGVGMRRSIEKSSNNSSNSYFHIGMEMTIHRLNLLSKKYNVDSKLEISALNPALENEGTKVVIYLPYKYGEHAN